MSVVTPTVPQNNEINAFQALSKMNFSTIPNETKCGIDFVGLKTTLTSLQGDAVNIKTKDDAIVYLLSDKCQQTIKKLADQANLVTPNTITCMGGKVDCSMMSNLSLDKITLNDLDNLEKIIDKHYDSMKVLIKWATNFTVDASKMCNQDVNKIYKVKNIISKLAYLFVDQSLTNANPIDVIKTNTNLWKGVAGCLCCVIFILCIVLLFKGKKGSDSASA
jgi:hypothetical protein